MLEALVGAVVVLLVIAGLLVMIGPGNIIRRLKGIRRSQSLLTAFEASHTPDVPPALNPKTQRVIVAAARLSNWLRSHGQDDSAREIRVAAARMTGNEPSGLYALNAALRRMRVVNISSTSDQERLKALASELRTAVQDRFEQLELLPRP
ncbi:MAG TPA: hypothetical protein VNA65_02670 [Candidatus Dormibacteraeota bacterium]|nr:hypothetical protein [Candidatus Dormibacteraeota bacterium]